jgi:hypothetical protein
VRDVRLDYTWSCGSFRAFTQFFIHTPSLESFFARDDPSRVN